VDNIALIVRQNGAFLNAMTQMVSRLAAAGLHVELHIAQVA